MHALVTGGAGLLGRHVVEALLAAGHDVHMVDLRPIGRSLAAGFRETIADLLTWDGLDAAIGQSDAIVHLAAIPNFDNDPEEAVYRVNTSLAARVSFATIRVGGVRRFVYASSQTALGLPLAPDFVVPDFVPVDESHPDRPREGYGLSKLAGEQLCELVSQRLSIPSLAIRLPVVWAPDSFSCHVAKRTGDPVQAAKSLFAYVDARDAAEAFVLALGSSWDGFQMVHVAADRPFADREAQQLVAEHFGGATHKRRLEPDTPLFAIDKARRLLGYRPRFRWSEAGIVEAVACTETIAS